MKKPTLRKVFVIVLFVAVFSGISCYHSDAFAANYPLEIIQPRPNLNTLNRYYKAYPGIEYKVPVGVFGGLYPFVYALANAPSGMVIDPSTGIITWPNPTTSGSPHSVTARVTDNEGTTTSVTWTITVTTSGFIFLDSSAGSGGNGSINSPFDELADVWGANGQLSTYDDYFMYFRAGTYGLSGGAWVNCPGQQCGVELDSTEHPIVWMGYPGEVAIIDHEFESGSNGGFLRLVGGADDLWMNGLKFQNGLNHNLRMGGGALRVVLFDNIFYNGGPGVDGANSSFVMFTGSGLKPPSYKLVKDNTFDTASGHFAFLKSYATNKAVHEGNAYVNSGGTVEGLALKAYDQYVSVRNNLFDGDWSTGSVSGNWNLVSNLDISFNRILNARDGFGTRNWYGALTMNYHGTAGRAYIYRNTIEGTVTAEKVDSSDGPYHLYNNVIVNENSGTPSGSHVSHYNVTDGSQIILNNNLVGYPADGIIDANGNLTQGYSSYLGTHGHQTGGVTSPPPPPPPGISVPQAFRIQ